MGMGSSLDRSRDKRKNTNRVILMGTLRPPYREGRDGPLVLPAEVAPTSSRDLTTRGL